MYDRESSQWVKEAEYYCQGPKNIDYNNITTFGIHCMGV